MSRYHKGKNDQNFNATQPTVSKHWRHKNEEINIKHKSSTLLKIPTSFSSCWAVWSESSRRPAVAFSASGVLSQLLCGTYSTAWSSNGRKLSAPCQPCHSHNYTSTNSRTTFSTNHPTQIHRGTDVWKIISMSSVISDIVCQIHYNKHIKTCQNSYLLW